MLCILIPINFSKHFLLPVAAKSIGTACVLVAGVLSKAFVYILTDQSISSEAGVTDTFE